MYYHGLQHLGPHAEVQLQPPPSAVFAPCNPIDFASNQLLCVSLFTFPAMAASCLATRSKPTVDLRGLPLTGDFDVAPTPVRIPR